MCLRDFSVNYRYGQKRVRTFRASWVTYHTKVKRIQNPEVIEDTAVMRGNLSNRSAIVYDRPFAVPLPESKTPENTKLSTTINGATRQ
jgi:hypothetical protein